MFTGFLLSLRESLEAALVVGVVLGVLRKLGRRDCATAVWLAVAAAVVMTLLGAGLIQVVGLRAAAAAEPAVEGVALLVAAALITWMVFWTARQAGAARDGLEAGVRCALGGAGRRGVFVLTLVSVGREGLELAFFLTAAAFANDATSLVIGALGGGAIAAALAWGIFHASIRMNLRRFFVVTGAALVLFAGGLVGHAATEAIEAGWIPSGRDPLWDTAAWLDEASVPGMMASMLVGYSSAPSLAQVLSQAGYLLAVGAIAWRLQRSKHRRLGQVGAQGGVAREGDADGSRDEVSARSHAGGTLAAGAERRPRVVVLGAGFGGLAFARQFPRGIADVTVVDRTNHHLFQPLLYQVAAAGLAVPDIAQPVRAILASHPDVAVVKDEVTAIDPDRRCVVMASGQLGYDYLVVALGGRTSYFGRPEWEPHAPGLKTVADALRIRRQVLEAFERAERTDDPAERQRAMTVVVIGGGPTGVELAGAFAELQRHVVPRDFRRVGIASGRVILIEAGPRVLSSYSSRLSASAQRQLTALGVEVRLDTPVRDIREGEVVLDGETVQAGNIIWAAGVSGSEVAARLGGPTDRAGRIVVGRDLALPGHAEVFVIGDAAAVTDVAGRPVPATSPAAMQMGRYVARRIADEVRRGQRAGPIARPAFRYRDKGALATIGRSRAVARLGRLEFSGTIAWMLWLVVHLLFLVDLRSRLSVLMQWVYSYATYRPGARVIVDPTPARAQVRLQNVEA